MVGASGAASEGAAAAAAVLDGAGSGAGAEEGLGEGGKRAATASRTAVRLRRSVVGVRQRCFPQQVKAHLARTGSSGGAGHRRREERTPAHAAREVGAVSTMGRTTAGGACGRRVSGCLVRRRRSRAYAFREARGAAEDGALALLEVDDGEVAPLLGCARRVVSLVGGQGEGGRGVRT